MGRWGPEASAEVVAGGPPVHLDVESVTRNPHRPTLRVCMGGHPLRCEVQLDTRRAREPRILRSFAGLRTFDLSSMPPGGYFVEVTTPLQRTYFFDRSIHVGFGEALEVDLEDADRVWDGVQGAWIREP